MQPFNVHILGCGSALPTLRHNPSSQIIEVRGKTFMIDCGEGTQVQIRRAHIHFDKISIVFISHLHGDHCFGLIGMISTFGMLGRTQPLHIYAPKELRPLLDEQLDFYCKGLEYDILFNEVDTTKTYVVYEDRSVTVTTIPLNHRIPCCGFLIREKPTLPHIRRDMIDFYNIPISQRNNIKNGADWTTPEGDIIPNSRLTSPSDSPRAYAYCSDTKYLPELYKSLLNVDLLYHEATYCESDSERACAYFHSTGRQAAEVALKAKVKKLIIGHYSARYDDVAPLLEEARSVFPNTYTTNEMDVFEI